MEELLPVIQEGISVHIALFQVQVITFPFLMAFEAYPPDGYLGRVTQWAGQAYARVAFKVRSSGERKEFDDTGTRVLTYFVHDWNS